MSRSLQETRLILRRVPLLFSGDAYNNPSVKDGTRACAGGNGTYEVSSRSLCIPTLAEVKISSATLLLLAPPVLPLRSTRALLFPRSLLPAALPFPCAVSLSSLPSCTLVALSHLYLVSRRSVCTDEMQVRLQRGNWSCFAHATNSPSSRNGSSFPLALPSLLLHTSASRVSRSLAWLRWSSQYPSISVDPSLKRAPRSVSSTSYPYLSL